MHESYKRNKLLVVIHPDPSPLNPREDDNVGTMICSHRRYTLGDEQFDPEEHDGWDGLRTFLIEERGAKIVLPLSLYDHSGISMAVGEGGGWDSGQVGLIYMTREQLKKEFNNDLIKATQALRNEVKDYSAYLEGDIYGYSIENINTGEEIDSCWGFYGVEDAKNAANEVADGFEHPHEAAYAKSARQLHG